MKTAILAATALFAVSASIATAANIVVPSVNSDWHDTVGGTNVVEDVSFGRFDDDAGDGFNQVRWGTPSGSATGGRSGLGFRSLAPVNAIAIDTPFQIGELRHYNWSLSLGTAASTSQLDLSAALEIDGIGSPGSPYAFTTELIIDETLNAEPCVYPSDRPCADRVSFQQVGSSDTFVINGVKYTFEVIGFGSSPDDLLEEFISQEAGDTTAPLWARITQAPRQVSEPGSVALFAATLALLGWVGRRQK